MEGISFLFLLVAATMPTSAVTQGAEVPIILEVTRFRTEAFRDSIHPTHRRVADQQRILVVDSLSISADSAVAYLTLRDREHAHREVYTLVRREDRWHVIRGRINAILRLHGL